MNGVVYPLSICPPWSQIHETFLHISVWMSPSFFKKYVCVSVCVCANRSVNYNIFFNFF